MSVDQRADAVETTVRPSPKRPAPEQVVAVKPRRNMRLVLLGIALAVIFALLAVWAVNRAGAARSVVVVSKDVEAGDQIAASDLSTTQVRGGESLSTVPADHLESIVGMRASHPMPAGTLVNDEAFQRRVTPRSGEVLVPVQVKTGQYPASGLESGDSVRVVVTGGGQSLEGLEPGSAFNGVVLSVGELDESGAMTVDVSISSKYATSAAAAAGTGRISILNAAPGGSGGDG